tara:strand:+ start:516 stop:1190 length:675 start_codon:yes stop_codon:yes gene_type:complete
MKLLLERWRLFSESEEESIVLKWDEVDSIFKIFHLSSVKLGAEDEHEFTPRLPRYPMQDNTGAVIEDDFTPRVSVAPTIRQCYDALMKKDKKLYLYAADSRKLNTDNVKVLDLGAEFEKCKERLSNPSMKNMYGAQVKPAPYELQYYLMSKGLDPEYSKPSELPRQFMMDWKNCVPDAGQSEVAATGEEWVLEPTNMFFIGETDDSNETVEITKRASNLIDSLR